MSHSPESQATGIAARPESDDRLDVAHFAELSAGLVDVLYSLRLEPDMAFEYVTPSVQAMVGYTPQEHYDDPQLGMRLLDPRDTGVLMSAAQAPLDEQVDMTVRWIAKDSRLVWTHHRCIKRRRSDGSVVLYGAARDVTALYESAERYRLLAENGTDVIVVATREGRIEWVSESVQDQLGWRPDDLIGRSTRELFHPSDQVNVDEAAETIAEGDFARFEARVLSAANEERWLSVVIKPTHDESGAVVGRIEGWRDVSGEHETRAALATSQQRFRMMVENATDVVFHSLDGITQWVSPSVTALTGWLPEEVIGSATTHLWHPDDRTRAVAIREATYAGAVGRDELRFQRKDGTYIWFEVALQPFVEEDGRVGAVGFMRDVTDRVVTQMALAHSESLYRDLAENMSDVVYRVDSRGQIVWMSPSVERALGWSPDQLLGMLAADLLHPDDLAQARTARQRALARSHFATSVPEPVELRYRSADGPYVWMSVRGHIVRNDKGEIVGGMSALRDIDLQMATREALQVSEAKYHQLADMVLDMVVTFDVNGFADYVSPSVTRVLGWEPLQFADQPLDHLIDSRDVEATIDAARDALRSRTVRTFPLRAITANGDRRWVEVTVQSRPKTEGGLVVAIRDVDAAVRAEEQRATSERILRAALANAPSGMCVVGLDGRFLMVNAAMCSMLGRDEREMLELTWQDVTHPDDIERDKRPVVELFEGTRESVDLPKRYLRADGSVVHCLLNVAAVRDEAGEVEFFVSQMSERPSPDRENQA